MEFQSDVEYIAHYAEKTPAAPAVSAGGIVVTYEELWRKVRGFARYLNCCVGLHKGDVVLVKAASTIAYAVSYFGTHLAGCIIAPIEYSASGDSFVKTMRELDPSFCIVNANDPDADSGILGDRWIASPQVCGIADKQDPDDTGKFDFPDGEDAAVIMFTTGTTGVSKGVVHTHRSMIATVENLLYGCQMKEGTPVLTPGPMNHSGPIRKMVTAIACGGEAILLNGMKNMKVFFDTLDRSPVPVGCALVPSAVSLLLTVTGDKLGEFADKIDFIISDSAPLPEATRQRLRGLLPGVRLYVNYGSTEAGSVCMYDYNRFPGKRNCIGKAGPNSPVVTVDDDGNEFISSPDHPGLLASKGTLNMKGYWNAPELTAQVMHGGLVCTSDIGYIDAEGFIYILGRNGDVINVGGLKVAPMEVEEKALGYPGLEDCVCVPVDDRVSGKAVKLCVVLKTGEAFDVRGLRSYLMAHLENYKVPKYIVEIGEVPRTYNGKADRKAAARLFGGGNTF